MKSPSVTYIRSSPKKRFDLEKKDAFAADNEFSSLASYRPSPRKRFDLEKKDPLATDELHTITYIRPSPRKRLDFDKKDPLAADPENSLLTSSSIRRRHSSYFSRPESKFALSGSVANSGSPIITTSIKPDGVKYHPHSNSNSKAQQEFEDIVRRRSRIFPNSLLNSMAAVAPDPYHSSNMIDATMHNGPVPSAHVHPMHNYSAEQPSYLSSPYISGVLQSEYPSDPRYASAQPEVVTVLMV
jgi:hypothetical protein